MTICFDVDGCLIDKDGVAIEENIALLKLLSKKHKIIVWSGNGWSYALDKATEIEIEEKVCGFLDKYATFTPDIAFDDQEIDLGKLNIQV